MPNRLIFLGTGGGRHVMLAQVRKTGGIYVELDGKKFVIDPGPGSLVNARRIKLNPENWNGLFLSHVHPDNSSDADVLLDGMKEPFIVAERHCVKPSRDFYPIVSKYHQEKANVYAVKEGDRIKVNGFDVFVTKADHYDPTAGFVIKGSKTIGYAADGVYYKGQERQFSDCDVLILNVLVPTKMKTEPHKHMSVDEAIKMVKKAKNKPKLIVIQHFSFWMLRADVYVQAKIIEKGTGIKTVAAEDFMEIDLDTLKIVKRKAQEQDWL
ncbi:MAG: MBL fold metallo-hydrolase [Candidatus Aenigmarchaeota archaeon]|nr:MBL fold metallo-hydrolase [Candidatus Aenigmarchaeota archaeon]